MMCLVVLKRNGQNDPFLVGFLFFFFLLNEKLIIYKISNLFFYTKTENLFFYTKTEN